MWIFIGVGVWGYDLKILQNQQEKVDSFIEISLGKMIYSCLLGYCMCGLWEENFSCYIYLYIFKLYFVYIQILLVGIIIQDEERINFFNFQMFRNVLLFFVLDCLDWGRSWILNREKLYRQVVS